MLKHRLNILHWLLFTFLCICNTANANEQKKIQYQTIEWDQLLPADDLKALMNPPETVLNITDGSEQDSIEALAAKGQADEATTRYLKALKSERVVEELAEKSVKLPGFVVPLANDEENNVTEFFIVPYFGACLHMPPPPPNQIVYAKLEKGFKLESLYDAYWFEGKVKLTTHNNELGDSAYSLVLDNFYLYEEK